MIVRLPARVAAAVDKPTPHLRLQFLVALHHRGDEAVRHADVLQINDFVRVQIEGAAGVGDVSHDDAFAHAGLHEFDDLRQRAGRINARRQRRRGIVGGRRRLVLRVSGKEKPPIKPSIATSVPTARLEEDVIFIKWPLLLFSTLHSVEQHIDPFVAENVHRAKTAFIQGMARAAAKDANWRPHPELNWDQRFRKPLLYPFEL